MKIWSITWSHWYTTICCPCVCVGGWVGRWGWGHLGGWGGCLRYFSLAFYCIVDIDNSLNVGLLSIMQGRQHEFFPWGRYYVKKKYWGATYKKTLRLQKLGEAMATGIIIAQHFHPIKLLMQSCLAIGIFCNQIWNICNMAITVWRHWEGS